jgi:uncharacterized membrane protein
VIVVTFYVKNDCDRCDEVETLLQKLQSEFPHELVKININDEPDLFEAEYSDVPLIKSGPYQISSSFSEQDIRVILGASIQRAEHLSELDIDFQNKQIDRGRTISAIDQYIFWFTNHFLKIFNGFFFIFIGLAVLAPVLMHFNIEGPANVIYKVYRLFCHQLPYRSWFLFGQQAFYPIPEANLGSSVTIDAVLQSVNYGTEPVNYFLGSPVWGYKMALCQRDVAIYGSILITGIFYSVFKDKLPRISWLIWVIIGIIPMGIDGTLQLVGELPLSLFSWIPDWESTPIIRTITGILFGVTTTWLLLPPLYASIIKTRRMLANRFAIIKRLNPTSRT